MIVTHMCHRQQGVTNRPAPPSIEPVVRLIRGEGIGGYVVRQSPTNLPEDVLGQLGNRVQHALRAWTRQDRRVVKAAAKTCRPNPTLDTPSVIPDLGLGEAPESPRWRPGAYCSPWRTRRSVRRVRGSGR